MAVLVHTSPAFLMSHSDLDGFHRRRSSLRCCFLFFFCRFLRGAGYVNQVDSKLLEVLSYLLQQGAKPGTLDLTRLSTSVSFPRLKVRPTVSRSALVRRIHP